MQARISTNKNALIDDGSDLEYTPDFKIIPTLGDLQWVFMAIGDVLRQYELYKVRWIIKLGVSAIQ